MKDDNFFTRNSDDANQLKIHFVRGKGRPISLDYFLFTCAEEERTVKSSTASILIQRRRCQTLLEKDEDQALKLSTSLQKLFEWYSSQYPQLSSDVVLDYRTHGHILQEFVLLKADMDFLIRKSFKIIPERTTEQTKFDWSLVDNLIKEHFPTYSSYMISYLNWCYVQKPKEDHLDLRSIPPVGKYIKLLKRHKEEKPKASNEPTVKKNNQGSDEASEKLALKEVSDSLEKMRQDSSLKVITLEAQNSFIRRIQHKAVMESNEFVSHSIGEPPNRTLQIKRK